MRIAAILFLIFIALNNSLPHCYSAEQARLGATFSQQQCEYFGLDWKKAYESIASMDFEFLRLGVYWSRIEKERGKYDFSELDWQLQLALEKKIKVLLTVGMKAPRWPEYYLPAWLKEDIDIHKAGNVAKSEYLRKETLRFIRVVVGRYRDHEAIYAWQVENEPLNRAGPLNLWIGKDLLEEEIDLVKELDTGKPIVVNALTAPNGFLRFLSRFIYRTDPIEEAIELADIPAFNIYPVIGHKWGALKFCFNAVMGRIAPYMFSILQRANEKEKKAWITELQAEPWEPGKLVHLERGEELICPIQSYTAIFKELRSLDFEVIFLWGVEYWYFRKIQHGDSSWMDAMQEIIPAHPSEPAVSTPVKPF